MLGDVRCLPITQISHKM